MNVDEKPTFAWEPLTPRGVAAFAHARLGNLLLAQFLVVLLAAASVVWFLDDSVCPVIRDAIKNLPAAGQIRSSKLDWRGEDPKLLAEGRFLALDVDLDHDDKINSTADVQVEFGAGHHLVRLAARLRGIPLSRHRPAAVQPPGVGAVLGRVAG